MQAHTDGLFNALTGMGMQAHDPTLQTGLAAPFWASQDTQDRYPRQYKILEKLITTLPGLMTQRWGVLTLGGDSADDKLIASVSKFLDGVPVLTSFQRSNGVRQAFRLAYEYARATGNGYIIVQTGDDDMAEPVNVSTLKEITGLRLCDRWEMQPKIINYSTPIEHYEINQYYGALYGANNKKFMTGSTVHHSRVLVFRGRRLSDRMLYQNNGCDDDVLMGCIEAFVGYQTTQQSMARIAAEIGGKIFGRKGLFSELKDGGPKAEAFVRERVRSLMMGLSGYRTGIFDSDVETLTAAPAPAMTGLSDLSEQALRHFAANTDMFVSELMGDNITPTGLSDPTEGEKERKTERNLRLQSENFDAPIRQLLNLAFHCKEGPTKGKVPEDFGWEWLTLYDTSPEKQMEMMSNFTTVLGGMMAVDPRVAQAMIASVFGGKKIDPLHMNLPPELIEQLQEASIKAPEPPPEAPADEFGGFAEEAPPEEQLDSADPYPGISFKPPVKIINAFKTAVRRYEKVGAGPGLESATMREARGIARGEAVSPAKVVKAWKWFKRNARFEQEPADSPAGMAWALWGGSGFRTWVNRKKQEMDLSDAKKARGDSLGAVVFGMQVQELMEVDDG
jgi:hypothetical protein